MLQDGVMLQPHILQPDSRVMLQDHIVQLVLLSSTRHRTRGAPTHSCELLNPRTPCALWSLCTSPSNRLADTDAQGDVLARADAPGRPHTSNTLASCDGSPSGVCPHSLGAQQREALQLSRAFAFLASKQLRTLSSSHPILGTNHPCLLSLLHA